MCCHLISSAKSQAESNKMTELSSLTDLELTSAGYFFPNRTLFEWGTQLGMRSSTSFGTTRTTVSAVGAYYWMSKAAKLDKRNFANHHTGARLWPLASFSKFELWWIKSVGSASPCNRFTNPSFNWGDIWLWNLVGQLNEAQHCAEHNSEDQESGRVTPWIQHCDSMTMSVHLPSGDPMENPPTLDGFSGFLKYSDFPDSYES